MKYMNDEASLSDLVNRFERGTYPAAEWKHAEHLALAACYLYEFTDEEALNRARANIKAYNLAQGCENTGTSGYHETLTVFWMRVVGAALNRDHGRLAAVRAIVNEFAGQRDLPQAYYSFDVLKSAAARASWVPPDLQPSGLDAWEVSALDSIRK